MKYWLIGKKEESETYVLAPINEDKMIFYIKQGREVISDEDIKRKVQDIILKLHGIGVVWKIYMVLWKKWATKNDYVQINDMYRTINFEYRKLWNFMDSMKDGDFMTISPGRVYIEFWKSVKKKEIKSIKGRYLI